MYLTTLHIEYKMYFSAQKKFRVSTVIILQKRKKYSNKKYNRNRYCVNIVWSPSLFRKVKKLLSRRTNKIQNAIRKFI